MGTIKLTPKEQSAAAKLAKEMMIEYKRTGKMTKPTNELITHAIAASTAKDDEGTFVINFDDDEQPSVELPASTTPMVGKLTDVQIATKLLQLQTSAKSRGIDFNLSLKTVKQLLSRKTCHYTGVKFQPGTNFQRTIDRVDNNKGYVDGNVVACTRYINQLKTNITLKQFEQFNKGIQKVLHPVKRVKAKANEGAIIVKLNRNAG